MSGCVYRGVEQDVVSADSEMVAEMHQRAVKYDGRTEHLFSYLQVCTAAFASFAHGSNDVANAIGPLATIWYVYRHNSVDVTSKAEVPLWILAYGGAAIVLGLATYGYNVMRSLGNKFTYMSPARGAFRYLHQCTEVCNVNGKMRRQVLVWSWVQH